MRRSRMIFAVLPVIGAGVATTAVTATAQSSGKAAHVGVPAKEIRLAVVADVDTPVQPGLFQAPVDAMKAWAKVVNQSGGVAGKVIKQNNSTLAYAGSNKMVDLRKEAALQGVSSVKVWGCMQACYSQPFVDQGGSDVEGTQAYIATLPFYSEYAKNPTLKKLVKAFGGIDKLDSNAVSSWTAALSFQDAAEKTSAGGTLTRKSLLDALANETEFDAQSVIGPTDVAHHIPPKCIVITKLRNGKFVRVNPTKVGRFDCSPKNLTEMQLNLN